MGVKRFFSSLFANVREESLEAERRDNSTSQPPIDYILVKGRNDLSVMVKSVLRYDYNAVVQKRRDRGSMVFSVLRSY